MKRFRELLPLLSLALVVALLSVGPVFAQDGGPRGDRGERRGGRDWQNMSDEQREQFRQRMEERMEQVRAEQAERMREDLSLSEEEYSALAPMIEKVQQLTLESATAGRNPFGRGGRGGRGGPGGFGGFGGFGNAFGIEPSSQAQAVTDASESLGEVLDQESPSSDEVKQKLAALREARIALGDALRQAREELRGFLTPEQEASLVLQGLLD